jgi:polysaccharide export outer membrane protein
MIAEGFNRLHFAAVVLFCYSSLWICPQSGLAQSDKAGASPAGGNSASAPPARSAAAIQQPNDAPLIFKAHIGPGDELDITVYGEPELTQHVRVESSGDISVSLIDRIHVAGLSSDEASKVIEQKLVSAGYLKDPHVNVFVKEYTNQGIVVQGQVVKPGVYGTFGPIRLFDLLVDAGGMSPAAGNKVWIAHAGQKTTEEITLTSDPAKSFQANVQVLPGDVVTVAKAGIVYVIGEVNRPGGYVLQNGDDVRAVSAVQAVALAAGPTHTAGINGTRIIRRTPEGIREIPLPLKKMMEGKAQDVELHPDDILFIPNSVLKSLATTVPAIFTAASGAAIYRF